MKKVLLGFLLITAGSGCAIQPQEGGSMAEGSNASDEQIGAVEQAINLSWNTGSVAASNIVGMAIQGSTAYMWRADGLVCSGTWSSPCGSANFYNTGTRPTSDIVGVGIAKNTGRVYAYFKDPTEPTKGWVSQGTAQNLVQFSGGYSAVTLPFRPSAPGVRFSMSQLIEVDNSDNGEWYYYWQDVGGVVYRTTGTSVNSFSGSGPASVNAPLVTKIVGIAFGTGSPASIYTFYYESTGPNQRVNVSTTSLNLEQP